MTTDRDRRIVDDAINGREGLAVHGKAWPYFFDHAASTVAWADAAHGVVRALTHGHGELIIPFSVDPGTGRATYHYEQAPAASEDAVQMCSALYDTEIDRGRSFNAPPGHVWCIIDTNGYPGSEYAPASAGAGILIVLRELGDLAALAAERHAARKIDALWLTASLDRLATLPEVGPVAFVVASGIVAMLEEPVPADA